jgi:hypothetical protein
MIEIHDNEKELKTLLEKTGAIEITLTEKKG